MRRLHLGQLSRHAPGHARRRVGVHGPDAVAHLGQVTHAVVRHAPVRARRVGREAFGSVRAAENVRGRIDGRGSSPHGLGVQLLRDVPPRRALDARANRLHGRLALPPPHGGEHTRVLGALLSQRQLTPALRAQQVAVLRAVQLHVLHARAPHDARGGRARGDVVRLVVREVLLGRHGARRSDGAVAIRSRLAPRVDSRQRLTNGSALLENASRQSRQDARVLSLHFTPVVHTFCLARVKPSFTISPLFLLGQQVRHRGRAPCDDAEPPHEHDLPKQSYNYHFQLYMYQH